MSWLGGSLQDILVVTTAQHALADLSVDAKPAQPWLSREARVLIVGTLIPACGGLLMLFYDLVSTLRFHKSFRKAFRTLTSPFRNFLTLDDLEDPPGRAVSPATWKSRALALGAVLECVAWAAAFAYAETVGDGKGAAQAIVASVTWVRAVPHASARST